MQGIYLFLYLLNITTSYHQPMEVPSSIFLTNSIDMVLEPFEKFIQTVKRDAIEKQ